MPLATYVKWSPDIMESEFTKIVWFCVSWRWMRRKEVEWLSHIYALWKVENSFITLTGAMPCPCKQVEQSYQIFAKHISV